MTGDHNPISEAAAGATGGPFELSDAQKASLRETSASFVASIERGIGDPSSVFFGRADYSSRRGSTVTSRCASHAPRRQHRPRPNWPKRALTPIGPMPGWRQRCAR
jgi:hypothetical protein